MDTQCVIAGVALCLGLAGCRAPAEGPEVLRIASWNVQALFDGEEAGGEYQDYRGLWGEEQYRSRLTNLSKALLSMDEKPPDIIGLMEIENRQALEDFARLLGRGYGWTFFSAAPQAPLGLGLISRFPLDRALAHGVVYNGEAAPRPLLEARVTAGGKPLTLFVCHWKSKREGADLTEALRGASARVLLRRMRELRLEEPDAEAVILGDLNESPDEFYRRGAPAALMPDDPDAAARTGFTRGSSGVQADFLVLCRKAPPEAAYFPPQVEALYSPWESGGSYRYKGAWEAIDHFLLPAGFFDRKGWEFDSFKVMDQAPFVNAEGGPDAYNPRTGSGLSDHLPLLLRLRPHRAAEG
ncbi:MAG: endonuclease/exonuclease/phosphatase family protein [Spirochaetaceae bacterium]|nr:endonuclease/exonuclease/phosphatase family protein [Spirochaetaceae bacterium]